MCMMEVAINNSELTTLSNSTNNNNNTTATSSSNSNSNTINKCSTLNNNNNNSAGLSTVSNGNSINLLLNDTASSTSNNNTQLKPVNNIETEIVNEASAAAAANNSVVVSNNCNSTTVTSVPIPASSSSSSSTSYPNSSLTSNVSISNRTFRTSNGRPRKPGSNYVFKEENIQSYTDANGVVYKVTDHVYMDINKPNQPFAIACVLDFKTTKRDSVMIEVKRYYRPNEIPDGVYMPLMQDRLSENKSIVNELIVLEPIIKGRELFASDASDIYPCSFIKGRCRVFHYQDILEAKYFKPFADTFFCILTYNPDARRLANTQGEIRVGASHQAILPKCSIYEKNSNDDEISNSNTEMLEYIKSSQHWETIIWKSKHISDANLLTYLQASRSIAAFAGMCDRGNTDDMYEAAESDSTTIYALSVLHEMQYDTAKALQSLVKNPIPQIYDKKWNEEDQKKFVKGLRQYGKNFYMIHKELLPHKPTPDLVEFYYLWKKTPSALNSNISRRRIRPQVKKSTTSNTTTSINTLANKTTNNVNSTSSTSNSNKKTSSTTNNNANSNGTNEQFSGGSDMDSDNESDESSDQKQTSNSMSQTSCTNCFTTSSKDWQNGGQDGQLLCYDCRMYYKKYGELPQISNSIQTSQLAAANLLNASNKVQNNKNANTSNNTTTTTTSNNNNNNSNNNTNSIGDNKSQKNNSNSNDINTNTNVVKSNNLTNKETSEFNNEEDEELENEVDENEQDNDDEEADYDEDDEPAVSNIDDVNDLDDQEDRCDQEVNEINNKTLKEEVKSEPINKIENDTSRPSSAIIKREEIKLEEKMDPTSLPLNLKMENDVKQNQILPAPKSTGFLSINNFISSSSSSTSQLKNDNNLAHSPISKSNNSTFTNNIIRQPQSNTPDTNNLNMISHTPTPPLNTATPNRPPSSQNTSSSFQPFNFQPHMVAHAFQQLLQNPNFNLNNPNHHEQLLQHHLQQQQQHYLSKHSDSNQLNTSTTSNSHSACSSPVPNNIEDQPQPPPIPINILVNKPAELIKPDSNAMFMRVWDRGTNSCSRTDLQFKYLANAKYLKLKEEQSKQQKQKDARLTAPASPSLNNNQNFKNQNSKESIKCNSPFNSSKNTNEKQVHSNENGKQSFGAPKDAPNLLNNNINNPLASLNSNNNQFNFMGNFSQLLGANQLNQSQLQNQIQAQIMQQHQHQQQQQQQQQLQQQNQQKQIHMQQVHQMQLMQQQQEQELMQLAQQKLLQQQQQQNKASSSNGANHHQPQNTTNLYDSTPALKQLRDIADRSNPNPLFNLQNHGNNQQFLMNEFNKLFQNPELLRKFQQNQNNSSKMSGAPLVPPVPVQQAPTLNPPPNQHHNSAPNSADQFNFENFLKQANIQNPQQAAQMLSAFLPPQHLKDMGISQEQFLSHMIPHFNQLQQQQQQQQQTEKNNVDSRFNMSPKLNNHSNKSSVDLNNKSASLGFHHSQKSQFTEDPFIHQANKQQNFNNNLDAKHSVKSKKSSSNSNSINHQKSTGENNMKSQNNNIKQHGSTSAAAPSPSHSNNDPSKLTSHSPALSNFSPASIPSRPSSINITQPPQLQMSSPLPHNNNNNQASLEQQQQQFLIAQQQAAAAALLFRNPQILNEQNNQNLKQQYQNMLNHSSNLQNQNNKPFFPNDLSPAPNHLRAGQNQQQLQQQQPPPHIPPPNLFMSPQQQQQQIAAQNEEINRLSLIERERQIRMFTQMMAAPGINEDIYRFHLQQQQQQQQQHQQKR